MKHLLKTKLRELYARLLFHTGLHRVVDRLMPRRLFILAGHCVSPERGAEHLPPDMIVSRERLERFLRWFRRHYDVCGVGEGWRRLRAGEGRRSVVALSLDDGYRDNRAVLLPLLRELDLPATVFLETRPLDERRVNWTHKYFWILKRVDPRTFVTRYRAHSRERQRVLPVVEGMARPGYRFDYQFKRFLKYEADPVDRDRSIDALFAELGGDEAALCDALYMDWDDARALRDGGVELGGHTVHHEILTRLDADGQRAELEGCASSLRASLGAAARTLAYPFGRRWDFDDESLAAARDAGFHVAVTTHPAANGPHSDPLRLGRTMIDDSARLHVLAAEACGGFELLRRLGLDLSE